jgi:hypothetical protein
MRRPNEYNAYFTVIGEFDPKDISVHLGMEPTTAWKKGDLHPRTQQEKSHSRWSLNSRLDQFAVLEDQVRDVIAQLDLHSSAVAEVCSTFESGMQLVGYFYSNYPGFGLDSKTVSDLAKLKLGIDCDFYYLYSDKEEDL